MKHISGNISRWNKQPSPVCMTMLPLKSWIHAGPSRQSDMNRLRRSSQPSGQTESRSIPHWKWRLQLRMQIAGSRLIVMFQHRIITEYSNTHPALWASFMVGCAVGSFCGIINCLFNRSRNAIYSKHRVKVLKARKAAFHKLKASRMGWTLNCLFHRDRNGSRETWTLLLSFSLFFCFVLFFLEHKNVRLTQSHSKPKLLI